jgi:hypothetical protein
LHSVALILRNVFTDFTTVGDQTEIGKAMERKAPGLIIAPADKMHDLNPVAILKNSVGPNLLPKDLPVHFHSNAF